MTPELQSALVPFLAMTKACEHLHEHEPIAGRGIEGGERAIALDVRDFRALAKAEVLAREELDRTQRLNAQLAFENERLRKAGEALLAIVDEFHEFCDSEDRPCGDPDAECSIGMGEWVSQEDRASVAAARAALKGEPNLDVLSQKEIKGRIIGVHGSHDGTSQEYEIEVETVETEAKP